MGSNSDWHVSLHFVGDQIFRPGVIQHRGQDTAVIEISSTNLDASFPVRFDQFIAAINLLPEGYAEGDGSFGIVGPEGSWKLCGTIYERFDSIQYAELQGICPNEWLIKLVKLLGADTGSCVVQNMQGGFFQSVAQFLTLESE